MKAKIVNITGLKKEQLDDLREDDYIKLGDKYYVSTDRAKYLVAKLQANEVDKSESTCNLQSVNKRFSWFSFWIGWILSAFIGIAILLLINAC
jgi:hypothetical protein